MARKSRKHIADTQAAPVFTEKTYKTAIYARLSVEDSGKTDKGDSIENQVYLVKQYIQERQYLGLCATFIDNGETGVSFDRPQFNELMNEVKAGRIDCIVVKDLSRFGRNYIETGNFLEKVFPFLGVRFISANDNYDTNNPENNNESLAIALKSLINDVYAKDISRKVTAALETKQKNGEFIGAWAAYGYKKSPEDKHKIIIDEEVVDIVRDIFKWKSERMGNNAIARKLNDLGVLSPNAYRYTKGLLKDKRYANTLWLNSTIKGIVQNSMYTGDMVQGKKKSRLMQGMCDAKTTPDRWVIVENTHEPIISRDTFNAVQKILNGINQAYHEKAGKYTHLGNPENIFKGLVVCADCGTKLMRYKKVNGKGNVHFNFLCPTYEINQTRACKCKKSLNELSLIQSVLNSIRTETELCTDVEKLALKLQNGGKAKAKVKTIKEQISDARRKCERITNLMTSLYGDFSEGILTEAEYLFNKEKYREEKRLWECKLDELIAEEIKNSDTYVSGNKWVAAINRFKGSTELTRDMLLALVEKITVSAGNEIDVTFKHRDEYEELIKYMTESGVAVSA